MPCCCVSHLVISAHASLVPAEAEREVLNWLEELGLEIELGEAAHLVAFDDAGNRSLIVEVDFFAVEPAGSTQLRIHIHRSEDPERSADDLAAELRQRIGADPLWSEDGFHGAGVGPG